MSDWFYRAGRALLNQSVRLYYRRIEVEGRERIPAAGPAILVANHPNSVIDAFLLCTQVTGRKISFIAKDSITRAPVSGWLVRRFGVVGVARGVDYGRQRELVRDRNAAAAATCVPRLLAGELLAIFGEGLSSDVRRLQLIRKGAMRFGFAAEAAAGFQLGLVWIPVGITYSAKQRIRSDVLIRIGQPFGLADLQPETSRNEQKALQLGTQRLQRDLEALLVNIEQQGLAQLIDRLSGLLEGRAGSLAARLRSQQRLVRALQYFNVAEPHRLAEFEAAYRRYERRLSAAGLSEAVVRQRHPAVALRASLQGLLTHSPLLIVGLYGCVNGFLPRWAAHLARRLGRRRLPPPYSVGPDAQVVVAGEALAGTLAAWVIAAVVFPLQTYLVFLGCDALMSFPAALALAAGYGLSLVPSWQFWVRRRDYLWQRLAELRDALRFLRRSTPALRLQGSRRRLQRRLRALLAAYDAAAPRA